MNKLTHCQFTDCRNLIQGDGKYCTVHYYGKSHPRKKICPKCHGLGCVIYSSAELDRLLGRE